MLEGLRTVVYFVDDMAKAKDWYRQVLEKDPYFDEPFYIGFNVGGFELGLHPSSAEAPSGSLGPHTYWGVPDIERARDRLLELGAGEHGGIEDVGEGIRMATVLDPFGNLLGIIQNPHFHLS